jgi:hypothetical protein
MKAGVSAKYEALTAMREDGPILGPWNAWLRQPEVGAAFWTATKAMTAFEAANRRRNPARKAARAGLRVIILGFFFLKN